MHTVSTLRVTLIRAATLLAVVTGAAAGLTSALASSPAEMTGKAAALPGQARYLEGRRPVWGCFVHLSGLRLEDDWLLIASSGVPQAEAFTAYSRRWEIETLFAAQKSRGVTCEDTHLTRPDRISQLLGLLALAFAWTYRTGERLAVQPPIPFKKRCAGHSNPSSATDSTLSATSS